MLPCRKKTLTMIFGNSSDDDGEDDMLYGVHGSMIIQARMACADMARFWGANELWTDRKVWGIGD